MREASLSREISLSIVLLNEDNEASSGVSPVVDETPVSSVSWLRSMEDVDGCKGRLKKIHLS